MRPHQFISSATAACALLWSPSAWPQAADDAFSAGLWHGTIKTSLLDGRPDTLGSVQSSGGDGASLVIGCGKYGATFLVSWDRYVTLSDQVTVRWRFDDRPIESARFRVASLGRTTGAPLFFNFEQFGRGLMASKRLVVEAGSSETAFDLTGADKAVPALLGPCISKLAAPSG